jgi:hypothetical protein
MDENQRRQRNRDERAYQQRKEQDIRTWQGFADRQAQLGRQQMADFERQQASFEAMGRKQATKDREEEEYRRSQAMGGPSPGSYTGASNYTSAGKIAGSSSNNVIPALASLIIPGLGQLVQGRLTAGLLYFVVGVGLWLVFLGWLVHIVACIDASRWKGC